MPVIAAGKIFAAGYTAATGEKFAASVHARAIVPAGSFRDFRLMS